MTNQNKIFKLHSQHIQSSTRNNFKEGCVLDSDTKFEYLNGGADIVASDLNSLIDHLIKAFNIPNKHSVILNSCGEIGRLDLQVYTRNPFLFKTIKPATWGNWTAGRIDIYLHDLSFIIEENVNGSLTEFKSCNLLNHLKGQGYVEEN